MALYAEVIIDISVSSLDRSFIYLVPELLHDKVYIGMQVIVPFGKGNRLRDGFIIELKNDTEYDLSRIKDIADIKTDSPAAMSDLIYLASWIRQRYGCSMAQALKTVLPVRKQVKHKEDVSYRVKDREKAVLMLEKSKGNKRDKARVRLLETLLKNDIVPARTISGVLQISYSSIAPLLKADIIEKITEVSYRNPDLYSMKGYSHVHLNDDQKRVSNEIISDILDAGEGSEEKRMVHLIHGITGSGKTEVYMDIMDQVLASGRQVIVLIPEISLTLQTVSRFYEHFGDRICVMHSRLSAGERYDQYVRARDGLADIMIGPRSALFTPFERLGLIIIDEEHEGAYKSESAPRYHARETAIERARICNAGVVLGSATPSVDTYMKALNGEYRLHELKNRARSGSSLPDVIVADMRNELRMKNRGILSSVLKDSMRERLEKGEQIMLFINRRGYAGFVSCRSCGEVIKCRHCDVSLTAHRYGILKCHYCGYEERMPDVCPSCGSPYIAAFGLGTQKVEDLIKREFPDARVLRMDRDTTSGKDDMKKILSDFSEHKADILIGTQMIVKGHDFENVTLVGILAADLSMHTGDYLSSEKTFQLLVQAAGRSGRSSRRGQVIIQTYQPDHYAVKYAAEQDYQAFYEQEIMFRRIMKYPPISHMFMMLFEGKDEADTENAAIYTGTMIKNRMNGRGELLGPSKAGISKGKDLYRYVIYIKDRSIEELMDVKDELEKEVLANEIYHDIYINYDMDPLVLP